MLDLFIIRQFTQTYTFIHFVLPLTYWQTSVQYASILINCHFILIHFLKKLSHISIKRTHFNYENLCCCFLINFFCLWHRFSGIFLSYCVLSWNFLREQIKDEMWQYFFHIIPNSIFCKRVHLVQKPENL